MAVFIRAKRVSDPLDDRVKARILSSDDHGLMSGYASSGSEHDSDDSFLSSLLVHAFFDLDHEDHDSAGGDSNASGRATTDEESNDGGGGGGGIAHAVTTVHDLLDRSRKSDLFGRRLHSAVAEAAEALGGLKSSGSGYRRAVTARLQELGYSAGVCKARWESSGGGLTAGNYEYIDVLVNNNGDDERYIVDLDFAAQFEIARATVEYRKLVRSLPAVMVAKGEEVKQAVRIIAETAKRSLKSKDLSVPPWRKRRYMLANWFGPYRRTVNTLPSAAGATVAGRGEIQCRAIGFSFKPATPRIVPPLEEAGRRWRGLI